jgi:secreted trypsin-like serine protease
MARQKSHSNGAKPPRRSVNPKNMKASLYQPLAFLVGFTGAVTLAESNSQLRRSLIIGGTPTTNLEFPFYVQSKNVRCATVLVLAVAFSPLRRFSRNKHLPVFYLQLTCGGTLVAKDFVLSAAHCEGT